jgi:excisionase family DNA binding protein
MDVLKMPKIILDTKFYSLEEIAQETGLSKQTLRNYIKENRLEAQKIGKGFFIREENFRKFLNT